MRATTTRSGACRKPTTGRCSRSWCWKASRPGLSWLTILKKRENFRRAFHGFDAGAHRPLRRQGHRPPDGRRRHRAQPAQGRGHHRQRRGAPEAAEAHEPCERSCGASSTGARRSTDTRSFKTVPAETPISKAISKALKAEGFRFVGPTTIYAFMQSTGMVNDHLVELPSPRAVRRAAAAVQGAAWRAQPDET